MFGQQGNSGFSFSTPTTTTGQQGFTFGQPAANTQSTGLPFGTSAPSAPRPVFGATTPAFGSAPATSAPTLGFAAPQQSSFGGFGAAPTQPFSFSTPAASTATAPAPISFTGQQGTAGTGLSFGTTQPATSGFGFGTATPAAPAATFGAVAAPAASTFGAAAPATGTFGAAAGTFGQTAPASGGLFGSSTGGGGFGTAAGATFGAPATTSAPSSFSSIFAKPAATAATTGFNFGGQTVGGFGESVAASTSTVAAVAPTVGGFGAAPTLTLGAPATSVAPSLSFGAPAAVGTTQPGTFTFASTTPVAAAATTSAVTFSLGGAPANTVAPSSTAGTQPPPFSFTANAAAGAGGGFNFAAPATSSAPSFFAAPAIPKLTNAGDTAGVAAQASTAATAATSASAGTTSTLPGFSLPSSSGATTFGFGTQTAATAATTTATTASSLTSFLTPAGTSAAAATKSTTLTSVTPIVSGTSSAPFTLGGVSTATTTTAAAATAIGGGEGAAAMTFRDLEEAVNKWTMELEEQEKLFLNQATQVNAWNRVLIGNAEKISSVNESLETVKLEQQRLDHEIDFIVSQQRELEEMLTPLERSVEQAVSLSGQQHTDLEREHTYQLAETTDAQLKQMTEDLKEVIEHLNTSTRSQDSNDPMARIGMILNAHMDSLHWIDQQTVQLQRRFEESLRLYEVRRQDHERSFTTFN